MRRNVSLVPEKGGAPAARAHGPPAVLCAVLTFLSSCIRSVHRCRRRADCPCACPGRPARELTRRPRTCERHGRLRPRSCSCTSGNATARPVAACQAAARSGTARERGCSLLSQPYAPPSAASMAFARPVSRRRRRRRTRPHVDRPGRWPGRSCPRSAPIRREPRSPLASISFDMSRLVAGSSAPRTGNPGRHSLPRFVPPRRSLAGPDAVSRPSRWRRAHPSRGGDIAAPLRISLPAKWRGAPGISPGIARAEARNRRFPSFALAERVPPHTASIRRAAYVHVEGSKMRAGRGAKFQRACM